MIDQKILFFNPSIEGGGVEKNLFIVANHFAKEFKNVFLITASKEYKKKFNNKIKIISPYFGFWSIFGRKTKYSICLIILFFTLLKDRKIKVFSFQANIYCLILCKLMRIKIVVRSNSAPVGWSQNFLKKIIFKNFLKFSNKTIVNSNEFKADLDKEFNVKAITIYNPLNKLEIIKLSKKKINNSFFKKDSLNLINVGRFTDQKDHLTLLRAVNLIKYKIKFKLMIIGRGENYLQMKDFINSNNLQNNVKILEFMENPFPYMKSADVFVLSSKFEGLPNVLLEASVLKKFIISSKCRTGPSEILLNGKGGLLFSVENHKQLANKIIFYTKNRLICERMRKKTYNKLNRFDAKTNLRKYKNLFLSL
tara:strand:+ start:1707 stop:2801 length:1095 start_codon:yes stop_codon:yes gene_type:complete